MANPRLRIVLVDTELSARINLEKNLSRLGYHRVAPLSSLHELLIVIDNAACAFDLLVISDAVLNSAGAATAQAVRSAAAIRHMLVYQGAELQLATWVDPSKPTLNFALSCPPDQTSIQRVMSVVDASREASHLPQEISGSVVGTVPWVTA